MVDNPVTSGVLALAPQLRLFMSRQYDPGPRWAQLSLAYERRFPNHRGKRTLLRALYGLADRAGRPVVWRMQNDALLAIAPSELTRQGTIGWSCFQHGVWEPHVERALRELLHAGDTVYDVGANLGYFSAVMAQVVGSGGRVFAFEPVPLTFRRLALCRELNKFSQLTPLQVAVGATSGTLTLSIDPPYSGEASAHELPHWVEHLRVDVPVRRLDDLIGTGELAPPALIKIDVEGHEFAVVQGAQRLLTEHLPALIFELNAAMSRSAGWTASDLAALLRQAGDYRFFVLGEGERQPVELDRLDVRRRPYVDILALA